MYYDGSNTKHVNELSHKKDQICKYSGYLRWSETAGLTWTYSTRRKFGQTSLDSYRINKIPAEDSTADTTYKCNFLKRQ